MRLPRPRFSMKWLMVAVAVVGLAMGAEMTRRRRSLYIRLVSVHEQEINNWRNQARVFRNFADEADVDAALFRRGESVHRDYMIMYSNDQKEIVGFSRKDGPGSYVRAASAARDLAVRSDAKVAYHTTMRDYYKSAW